MKKMKQLLNMVRCKPLLPFWMRGQDLCADILVTCPLSRIDTIFDVGAHEGDETNRFRRAWPGAHVYAFEPSPVTFRSLNRRFRGQSVTVVNAAVSSKEGTGKFALVGDTDSGSSNHLTNPAGAASGESSERLISVEKVTIDQFCARYAINSIDVLKVDTEGHDLEVLKGAESLLSKGAIGFVRLECGIDPENQRHIRLKEVLEVMSPFGYRIFGFYDQENEFMRREPQLRRADIALISPMEAARNRGVARRRPVSLLDILVSLRDRAI